MVANHDFRTIYEKFDLGFKYFWAFSLTVGIILSISGLESKYIFGISAPGHFGIVLESSPIRLFWYSIVPTLCNLARIIVS
jgi:hypothetical protein